MAERLTTDVLIIGGGPAGMLSGIYLNLLGVSSIVLERQSEISQHPKAHELSARSIEILRQLGFSLEELREEASSYRDASRIMFGHTIKHELGEIDLQAGGNDQKYEKHLASPDPYLNLSQTELEKQLRKKLESCPNSHLLLEHQWEAMEEHAQGIKSLVHNLEEDGQLEIDSQYVICADGAGSRSRKSLGIKMIGKEKINDFISVYFEQNLREYLSKPAKLYWVMHPAAPGTFIAHHIEKRWVYHFPIFTPHEKVEHYPKEVVKERILTALGNPDIHLDIHSISLWRMTCQIADAFRKGRAFLVGDAAHRFPPTGGLGMNSGIGDVQNICWKLAMVLQGKAGEAILDTYEQERRPVIELNSAESLQNYFKIWEVPRSMGLNPQAIKWQAILLNSFVAKLFPDQWIHSLLQKAYKVLSKKILAIPYKPSLYNKVREVINDQIEHFDRIGLDLGYWYSEGAIIPNDSFDIPEQTVSRYTPSLVPGVRFPHFWVAENGAQKSSHEWLSPTSFTLLCNHVGEKWWKQQTDVSPELQAMVNQINVEQAIESETDLISESFKYPVIDIPLLLIRPDGQICWRPNVLPSDPNPIFNQLLSMS